MRNPRDTFSDFTCNHCGAFVTSMHMLSGVNNRNHCPYCLWSRHLDLYSAGDRLSACKAGMQPVGLTMKKGRNKYAPSPRGELMLVHECINCGSVSINRIAGDDDPDIMMEVFQASLGHDQGYEEIVLLKAEDGEEVYLQLMGMPV
jgi:predicted RNA-binding Zn-ribbon protein involved in translation (DUF1610 family)